MSRIILLGGSGFIGSNLLTQLEAQNFEVKTMFHKKKLKTNSKNFYGNILEPKKLDSVLKKDDIVINLVGQTSKIQTNFIETNILGAINLLDSCYKNKVRQLIFLSSINVYGENMKTPSKETDLLNPITFYGKIKSLTEEIYSSWAENYGINVTILRLSNIYGPKKKSGFIANLVNSTVNKKIENIAFNHGNQYRDLLYVDDVVNGIILAIKTPQKGFNIYNLSSGKRYSIKKIISIIEQLSGKKVNVKYSNQIPDEKCIWANNLKAQRFLKFSPTVNLKDGLELMIKKLH